MIYDKDLLSIQDARNLIKKAKVAQKTYEKCSQQEVDKTVKYIAEQISLYSTKLAELAVSETGFGNVTDKIFKNNFASLTLYDYIKDMKTRGIIDVCEEKKIWQVGVSFGVILGLIPSTNPTSTVIYKTLISLKSGNAIIFSPHPAAIKCITETVNLIRSFLVTCGHDENLVSVLSTATIEATNELMKNEDVSLILATGGKQMVKAAYSSGTPALGVGPGNVPAFIEKSANIKQAVEMIIKGKIFDNGVICASEQAVVVESVIFEKVVEEFKKQNCYFLNADEKKLFEKIIQLPNGALNSKIVGKTPQYLGEMAGVKIPDSTKVIIAFETGVGKQFPFSIEKLTPMLAFYKEESWELACEKCIEILNYGGLGHSLSIHSEDMDVITQFALAKPVSRILVNTPSTHGAIGSTTGLAPSFTLGCGAVGGSATSDNVTPLNLINIRRIAFGIPEKTQETNDDTIDEKNISEIVAKVIQQLSILNKAY